MSKGLRWRPPGKVEIHITPLAEEGRRTRLVRIGPVRSVTKEAHHKVEDLKVRAGVPAHGQVRLQLTNQVETHACPLRLPQTAPSSSNTSPRNFSEQTYKAPGRRKVALLCDMPPQSHSA